MLRLKPFWLRFLTVLGSVLLVQVILVSAAFAGGPGSFQNGNFESGSTGWSMEAFRQGAYFTIDPTAGVDNTKAACIMLTTWANQPGVLVLYPGANLTGANDARWTQTVSVKQNHRYLFYGDLRSQNVGMGPDYYQVGAILSVMGLPDPFVRSESANDPTSGVLSSPGYVYRDVSFNSGNNTSVKLAVRLGIDSGEAPVNSLVCADNLGFVDLGPSKL